MFLASGYAGQHSLSRSTSPEIGRVAAGRAYTLGCMDGFTLTLVCVAAPSGHTVRGVSESGPAINQGPH